LDAPGKKKRVFESQEGLGSQAEEDLAKNGLKAQRNFEINWSKGNRGK